MSTTVVSKARTFPLVLISSSVGKKFLVAVTGIISFGYVIGHMLGNLQLFAGQNQINMYAEALHSLGPLLWVIRAVLLAAFIVHIWLGLQLKLENMAARPVSYTKQTPQKSKFSGRTMWLTGLMVLAFFIYHILHFTARTTDARFTALALDAEGRYDVYSMVILGFQQPWLSAFYIVAVGLLCYHLSHGLYSMFQSLGLNNSDNNPKLERCAAVLSILIFLGYASIPVAVLAGWVSLPGGGH
jgi:succinate dehydrogenase / fumarate reductase cytochrome b subunit